MLAARLPGNSTYDNPRAGRPGGCPMPALPFLAKAADDAARLASGSAGP
jgi:hypothetical protein